MGLGSSSGFGGCLDEPTGVFVGIAKILSVGLVGNYSAKSVGSLRIAGENSGRF
jgi:hypothetical protein